MDIFHTNFVLTPLFRRIAIILLVQVLTLGINGTGWCDPCISQLGVSENALIADGKSKLDLSFTIFCPGKVDFAFNSGERDCQKSSCGKIVFPPGFYPAEDTMATVHYLAPKIQPTSQLKGKIPVTIYVRMPQRNEHRSITIDLLIPEVEQSKLTVEEEQKLRRTKKARKTLQAITNCNFDQILTSEDLVETLEYAEKRPLCFEAHCLFEIENPVTSILEDTDDDLGKGKTAYIVLDNTMDWTDYLALCRHMFWAQWKFSKKQYQVEVVKNDDAAVKKMFLDDTFGAIAYFGHESEPSLAKNNAGALTSSYKNAHYENNKKQGMSDDEAWGKSRMKQLQLDIVLNYSCYSLGNKGKNNDPSTWDVKLPTKILRPGGSYYGYVGKYNTYYDLKRWVKP